MHEFRVFSQVLAADAQLRRSIGNASLVGGKGLDDTPTFAGGDRVDKGMRGHSSRYRASCWTSARSSVTGQVPCGRRGSSAALPAMISGSL